MLFFSLCSPASFLILHMHICSFLFYVKLDLVPTHKYSLLPYQNTIKSWWNWELWISVGSVCCRRMQIYWIIFAFWTHCRNCFMFIGTNNKEWKDRCKQMVLLACYACCVFQPYEKRREEPPQCHCGTKSHLLWRAW